MKTIAICMILCMLPSLRMRRYREQGLAQDYVRNEGTRHPLEHAFVPEPDMDRAMAFVSVTNRIQAYECDAKTIAVVWEVGADEKFEKLKTQVRDTYGVDLIIGAIE